MLREGVLAEGLVSPDRLLEPDRVAGDELLLVHDGDYVERLTAGLLTEAEVRRLGFPWSPQLVERSYRAVGGTVAAARAALEDGVAVNLAGGTHHAFPGHGEGFCVFNDVAVAIRTLQRERLIRRVAVVDLDVHQGNGTHAIFAADDSVLTFSMHGARNYPFTRVAGWRDVELDDRTGDDEYMRLLTTELPRLLAAARADLVVYLAGADPHEDDRLGRLALTFDGLRRRDSYVLQECTDVGLPVAVTIAGGYGRDIGNTVRVHLNTVAAAGAVLRRARSGR